MDRQLKLLVDIQISIQNIEKYLGDKRLFSEFETNDLLRDAIERNLITIGEATNNLLKINPEIQISDARKVVNARNRLTHGYDEIDSVQIWNILIKNLPILKKEVLLLIN